MSSRSAGDGRPDFLAIAKDLGLVSAESIAELTAESEATGIPLEQLVLRHGLLSAAQFDIVETLRSPRDAVPGYEIVSVLGRGGMGVVYRARQLALDRLVALKTVLLSQLGEQSALRRFEQEATLAARL